MEKDDRFEKWNKRKLQLSNRVKRPVFFERSIWYAALGENIGSEEFGKAMTSQDQLL